MPIREDLKAHFWIGHTHDESFEDTYRWVNVTFLDKIVFVTGCICFDGIWYVGFHLA